MMGRDHALSGAFVFAALATTLHVNDAHLAAGVALCAGAGVLPDIDHQDTSISSSFGFLTEGFSRLVAMLSGGHRHGTHSIVRHRGVHRRARTSPASTSCRARR